MIGINSPRKLTTGKEIIGSLAHLQGPFASKMPVRTPTCSLAAILGYQMVLCTPYLDLCKKAQLLCVGQSMHGKEIRRRPSFVLCALAEI